MNDKTKANLIARCLKAFGYVCAGFMYGGAAADAMYGHDWIMSASGGTLILLTAINLHVPTP